MSPQTILLISQGVQLLGTLGPLAIEAAVKIKQLLDTPDSDFSVELKAISAGAIASADETLQMIEAWKSSKGLS